MISSCKASVIIPTYNRSELLRLSLESLCSQTASRDSFEVIIVDDGSTDNSHEVAFGFSNELNINYLYQEDSGYRVAMARNKGIMASQGEICILLDCGILVASDAIEEHIHSHKNDDRLAVLGYIYGFDEYNENAESLLHMNLDARNADSYFPYLIENRLLDLRESTFQKLGDDLSKWPAPWAIFFTGFLSIRKETILEIGLFDESYNTWGMEDIDFGLNMFIHGVKIILNRNLRSIHYPHEKSRNVIGEEALKEKKKLLHNKYNLKSTEIYINTYSGRLLNEIMING